MFITNTEFRDRIERENPHNCASIRHYTINNNTPYAEIRATYDLDAGKYCCCQIHESCREVEEKLPLDGAVLIVLL